MGKSNVVIIPDPLVNAGAVIADSIERYSPEAWNIASPERVYDFVKEKGFFSFIIPKEYGGLEFSPLGLIYVMAKIGSRSGTLASMVGVPNSLGPAELLMHYGTDEQKKELLPKLASGEHVPCFALTGPYAGSDATSMPDTGIVCKGDFEGEEIIGIKLNFSKRYITLAPIAERFACVDQPSFGKPTIPHLKPI